MFLKARRGLEKILGFGSALISTKWSIEPCGEPNRLVGFNASGAWTLLLRFWNVGNDASIDLSDVAVGGGRSGHHFLDDHPPDVVLRRSDVLYTLRSRPAVRKIRGAAGPCPGPSARVAARPGRPGTGHYKSTTNNESQRSRNALHNLPFPQIGIRGSPKRFPEICEGHGEAARWRVECAPQAFRSEVIPYSKPVRRSLRGKGPARR